MPTTLRSKTDLSKIDTIVDEVVRAVQTEWHLRRTLNVVGQFVGLSATLKEKRGVLNFDPVLRTPEKNKKKQSALP